MALLHPRSEFRLNEPRVQSPNYAPDLVWRIGQASRADRLAGEWKAPEILIAGRVSTSVLRQVARNYSHLLTIRQNRFRQDMPTENYLVEVNPKRASRVKGSAPI